MERSRKLSIIADPWTLLLGALCMTIVIGGCAGVILFCWITGDRKDILGSLAVFGTMGVLAVLTGILALPRWLTRITFRPESVIIKTALRRPVERPYKYYQYVYRAWYWHGSPVGLGMNVAYIVISHRRMRDEELTNINQPAPSADVIKIHYSPKTYRKLMEILPREMRYKLKVCGFE